MYLSSLEDVLNKFPFRSRTPPSTRPSSWSQRLSTFYTLRFSDHFILDLSFLSRLSRYSASGALCRHHHSTTFPIFFLSSTKMLINKRRNSDPAAAVSNNANLGIPTPRQTKKIATELCSFGIIWWSLLQLVFIIKVDEIWGQIRGE